MSRGRRSAARAWLLTVARNRLRDQRKSARAQRAVPLDADRDALAHVDDIDLDSIPDRRLELMLVCAHPAIAPTMRTPLMLNTVLGFTAGQVGRAFSVPRGLTRAGVSSRSPTRIPRCGTPTWSAGLAFTCGPRTREDSWGGISLTHDTAERQYLERRRDRADRQDRASH